MGVLRSEVPSQQKAAYQDMAASRESQERKNVRGTILTDVRTRTRLHDRNDLLSKEKAKLKQKQNSNSNKAKHPVPARYSWDPYHCSFLYP